MQAKRLPLGPQHKTMRLPKTLIVDIARPMDRILITAYEFRAVASGRTHYLRTITAQRFFYR
jgi:hypothetical protein